MRKTFEVVDGFYAHPETLRARALREDTQPYIDPDAVARIRQLLGMTADRLHLRVDAGRFVIRGENVPADDGPKQDEADWVALAFLSTAEPPGSGLSFWQVPNTRQPSVSPAPTAFIPVRHNRLVLYRPAALSRQATAGFGRLPAEAWLHHDLRFDVRPGQEGQARAQ
ncbi:hypothetical protein OG481_31495 [Streptomyces longwoodensis]|uniref:hypothetical protein n=1 Tax=Streptomyces longwoodensis TaxID=68231 RepID=UPI002DD929DC|nr:hypothetical protein [Streptomyces longwoodensis]WRY92742.1 hypothetical protein OG481_31495 [Streptomyces longwoodensis]